MKNDINISCDSSLPQIDEVEGEIQKKENINYIEVSKMEDELEDYMLFLQGQHRKKNTWKTYYESAKRFLIYTNNEINEKNIRRYIAYINKKYRGNTISTLIIGMDKYLDYKKLTYLRIPIPRWRPVHRDTITTEEITKIREYARKYCGTQTYLMILFITDLDCRNHEISRSRWTWIKGNKIFFKDCKTGDTIGRLTPELQRVLNLWKKERPLSKQEYNDYIFIHTKGTHKGIKLSDYGTTVRKVVKQVSKKIIGRKICPQDLRASIITEEHNHFINPVFIQKKARHRSKETTQIYNHADDMMFEKYISNGTIFDSDKPCLSEQKPKHKTCII